MSRAQSTSFDAPHRAHHPPVVLRAADLRMALAAGRGFTIAYPSGEPVREGLAVCAEPCWAMQFPAGLWDDHWVGSWLGHCTERLGRGDVCVGGWLDDDDRVWLDLVRVYPADLDVEARRAGRRTRQHAGFDLGRQRLLVLDGPP